ncbi:hypothetical protein CAEBREN_29043 [Caenorhabditis brenneri]|uniref:Uncharacterized protein n=1 Tax=Caenorhabditis brenneri TaxID=135651 RepID=G0NBB3_CAEBE|nr:hypothetical protein CAEBREN_29043 [Caenorhabditis brenneri]
MPEQFPILMVKIDTWISVISSVLSFTPAHFLSPSFPWLSESQRVGVDSHGIKRISAFFKVLSTPYLHASSHYSLIKNHVEPCVNEEFKATQNKVFNIICEQSAKKGGIDLAGDAMFDSPGYSAKIRRYGIIDVATNLVVKTELIEKANKGK